MRLVFVRFLEEIEDTKDISKLFDLQQGWKNAFNFWRISKENKIVNMNKIEKLKFIEVYFWYASGNFISEIALMCIISVE